MGKAASSLIKESSVGKSYTMTVVHIGAAMVNERKGEPLYGGSIRAEYSHASGSIHATVFGSHKFWDWLKEHEDLLTTECTGGWRLKKKVVDAVLEKVSAAYVKWVERGCPSRKDQN